MLAPGTIEIAGRRLIDFSSNDYLGLSLDRRLIEAGITGLKTWGCGARASMLMSGCLRPICELEQAIAAFKGTEAALVFGSGYLANVSIISTLCRPGDAVFMDRLCHASIIDGVILSKARLFRFGHNDIGQLEILLSKNRHRFRQTLIVIESLYSMDGDIAPIETFLELKDRFNAMLMVDEAHAVGVFGREGEGLADRGWQKKPDILIGTFGKALGGYGAFAAVSADMREYLVNRCRGIIFSTALPPSVVSANIEAVGIVKGLHDKRRAVLNISHELRTFIQNSLGIETTGQSQIVPLIVKDVDLSLRLEKFLSENGIFARSIRPPTVPEGTARIRFSMTACHTAGHIDRLKDVLTSFFRAEG